MQTFQEGDLVGGARVHEEEQRVHDLGPVEGGAVKHGLPGVDRHRHDDVGQLREEGAEPEEVRLATGRPFRANQQVAALQEGGDPGGVGVALAVEREGRDGGEELEEAVQPADM